MTRCWFLLCAMVVVSLSCAGETNTDWKIDLGIRNACSNRLERATVDWGGVQFVAGIVTAGGEAVEVGFDRPVPRTATVYYTLFGGKEGSKTLPVLSAVPKAAFKERDMHVSFVIHSNETVTVEFFHYVRMDDVPTLVPYEPDTTKRR